MFSAIFLLPCLLLVGAQHCGPEELDGVGERVTACVIRHQESLQDTAATFPDQVYMQEAACDTVRRILEECGSMWAACYTQPEVKQLRELQLAALRDTLAASLDPDTCALAAPEVENEWSEVEVEEEQLPGDEILQVGDDVDCSDELCVNAEEVSPPKSGLLGRTLNLISGGR